MFWVCKLSSYTLYLYFKIIQYPYIDYVLRPYKFHLQNNLKFIYYPLANEVAKGYSNATFRP
jgi:hypothetical protein